MRDNFQYQQYDPYDPSDPSDVNNIKEINTLYPGTFAICLVGNALTVCSIEVASYKMLGTLMIEAEGPHNRVFNTNWREADNFKPMYSYKRPVAEATGERAFEWDNTIIRCSPIDSSYTENIHFLYPAKYMTIIFIDDVNCGDCGCLSDGIRGDYLCFECRIESVDLRDLCNFV